MTRIIRWVPLLVAAATAGAQGPARRPEFERLNADARSLVATWLRSNCGAGERSDLRVKVEKLGAALEPVFWEAYRLGPAESELKALRAESARAYAQRRETLERTGEALFGKKEVGRLLAVTEAQFADRAARLYAERFKGQALNGLGVVGTEKSEDELTRLAEAKDHPDQVAAREAVKAIRARKAR